MVKKVTYNIQEIKDRVEAAHLMQEAGRDADAEKILTDLGKDILDAKE